MSLWPLRLGNPLKQLSKCVPKDVSRWQPRVETSKKDSNAIMNRALRKKVLFFTCTPVSLFFLTVLLKHGDRNHLDTLPPYAGNWNNSESHQNYTCN